MMNPHSFQSASTPAVTSNPPSADNSYTGIQSDIVTLVSVAREDKDPSVLSSLFLLNDLGMPSQA